MMINEARAADYRRADAARRGRQSRPASHATRQAIGLIREFADAGKPVAAICHGPWLLVEADLLRGRQATSWPSIRTDLKNAGAKVVDEAAVTDGNIVTSRKPDDVPAFTEALIAAVEQAPAESDARQTSEAPA